VAEELIAGLSGAFLCAEFGFDGDIRSARYIASWIELLKADKRAFFAKAAYYLRGLALMESAEAAA
jgi:antirestriction protein ArdC